MISKEKSIDGLRGILFLSVSFFHYYLIVNPKNIILLKNGFYAVESFFLLSGFLITSSVIKRYETIEIEEAFYSFLITRVFRLYGAFIFLIFLEFIILVFINKEVPENFLSEIIFGLSNSYNWWLIIRDIPYFEKSAEKLVNLHFWSLSIEWQFYLIWGLTVGIIYKFFKNKVYIIILIVASILVMLSLFFQVFYLIVRNNFEFAYYSTFTRFYPFMIGSSFYIIYEKYLKILKFRIVVDYIGIFCLIFLILIFSDFSLFKNFLFPTNLFLVSLFTLGVLISSLNGYIVKLFLETEILSFIGKISYSGYLLNYPVFYFFSINFDNKHLDGFLELTLLMIINLSLATFGYYICEEPYLRNKKILKNEKFQNMFKGLSSIPVAFFSFIIILNLSNNKLIIDEYKNDKLVIKTKFKNDYKEVYSDENVNKNFLKKMNILLIGDSVAEGASYLLKKEIPNITIDTKISRQFSDIKDVIKNYNLENFNAVIISLGTNGYIFKKDIDWLINYLETKPIKLFFITTHVPRIWKNQVNQILKSVSENNTKIDIMDWECYSKNKNDIYISDNVHFNSNGAKIFSKFIAFEISKNYNLKISYFEKRESDFE